MPQVSVAVVNDFDLVVLGVAALLDPYRDRIVVVDLTAGGTPDAPVDVALFDTFAAADDDLLDRLGEMRAARDIGSVLLYTWEPDRVPPALRRSLGDVGVVAKSAPPDVLADAIVAAATGSVVECVPHSPVRRPSPIEPLSAREAEVLALVCDGLSNREIATLLYVSAETVKTYVARLLPKVGARNRTEAAAWALRSGLVRDRRVA